MFQFKQNIRHIIVLLLLLPNSLTRKTCKQEERRLKYSKSRTCYRSNILMISSSQVDNLKDCVKFANRKKALAFNFSPAESQKFLPALRKNCEVLGCPEVGETETLVQDMAYDYYSSYSMSNATENATCIKSVGLFTAFDQKQTYFDSIKACQNISADLADVTTEIRTNYLSRIVNSSLDTWYKVAYVGMDDFESKKEFITSSGMPLNCIKYRAWAPGHPRFEPNQNNCVVLDTEKMWRVVDCKRKMPAICEIFPQPPKEEFDFSALDCLLYSNKSERNTCDTKVLLWQIYKNTSRMEQCAIVNDLLKIKNDLN